MNKQRQELDKRLKDIYINLHAKMSKELREFGIGINQANAEVLVMRLIDNMVREYKQTILEAIETNCKVVGTYGDCEACSMDDIRELLGGGE